MTLEQLLEEGEGNVYISLFFQNIGEGAKNYVRPPKLLLWTIIALG